MATPQWWGDIIQKTKIGFKEGVTTFIKAVPYGAGFTTGGLAVGYTAKKLGGKKNGRRRKDTR